MGIVTAAENILSSLGETKGLGSKDWMKTRGVVDAVVEAHKIACYHGKGADGGWEKHAKILQPLLKAVECYLAASEADKEAAHETILVVAKDVIGALIG